jgi:hypothetical protein
MPKKSARPFRHRIPFDKACRLFLRNKLVICHVENHRWVKVVLDGCGEVYYIELPSFVRAILQGSVDHIRRDVATVINADLHTGG